MSIKFVCACGKEFEANDEFAGRRAICPACKREFRFAVASFGPLEELPESIPAALTQILTDERLLESRPKANVPTPPRDNDERRPFWKDPIVVIGAAIPTLILLAFVIHLYHEYSAKQFRWRVYGLKTEADNLAKSEKLAPAALEKYEEVLAAIGDRELFDPMLRKYADAIRTIRARLHSQVRATLQREEKERLALEIEEKKHLATVSALRAKEKAKPAQRTAAEMRAWGEFYMRVRISECVETVSRVDTRFAGIERVEIHDLELHMIQPDNRKIPYLWEATANTVLIAKAKNRNVMPEKRSFVWKSLFNLAPEESDDDFKECWLELTDARSGHKTRQHYVLSEWTKEFRSKVNSTWLQKFQEYERQIGADGGIPAREKRELLQEMKQDLANSLAITVDELHEILEATD